MHHCVIQSTSLQYLQSLMLIRLETAQSNITCFTVIENFYKIKISSKKFPWSLFKRTQYEINRYY